MSLQTRIESLIVRLASEFKLINASMGNLSNLSVADKSSLVSAINEVKRLITAGNGGEGGGAGGAIDDQGLTSTTTTFSASKINALLAALKENLLGGADAAFDTLKELQLAVQTDQTGLANLLSAIDMRVRWDSPQALTTQEQLQARLNIGAASSTDIGDVQTDFVAVFEAALIA